jgi:hypothetical protein
MHTEDYERTVTWCRSKAVARLTGRAATSGGLTVPLEVAVQVTEWVQ